MDEQMIKPLPELNDFLVSFIFTAVHLIYTPNSSILPLTSLSTCLLITSSRDGSARTPLPLRARWSGMFLLGPWLIACSNEYHRGQFEPKKWDEDDVDIKISHCGICGSDLHTLKSGWGPTAYRVYPFTAHHIECLAN